MRIITLLLICFVSFNNLCKAQSCPINNIITNPAAPVNTQNSSKINLFNFTGNSFNWKYSNSMSFDNIMSPFFTTDNPGIQHFYDPVDGIKDIYPAEGWELIKKDFGFDDNNLACGPPNTCVVTDVPYLILYNKFSGILRIFVARGEANPIPANGVKITMEFSTNIINQTSLLDFEGPLVALDATFVRNKSLTGFATFLNTRKKWFYTDFQMQYDPCVCLYQSALKINVKLTSTSTVSIQGTSSGTIVSNGAPIAGQDAKSSISLGDVTKVGKSLLQKFKQDNEVKNQMINTVNVTINNSGSIDAFNKVSGIQNLFNSSKSSSFLKSGLSAIPYLDKAMDVVNLFFGGGKTAGPQPVEIMPMTINMTHQLTGTIETEYPYKAITFRSPGSLYNSYPNSEYPYYNEILGVFNLLKTPVFQYRSGGNTPLPPGCNGENRADFYRLKNPIQYVLNPAAKLQVMEINAALSIDGKFNCGDFTNYEGFNPNTSSFQSRTEYINLACMREKIYRASYHTGQAALNAADPVENPGVNFRVKLMVRLRRLGASPSTQDILLAVTYPANIEFVTSLGTTSSCSSSLVQVQETATTVQSFCQGAYFNSARFYRQSQSTLNPNTSLFSNELLVNVFPTITNNEVNVSLTQPASSKLTISIKNSIGQILTQKSYNNINPGINNTPVSVANLPNGIYFITIMLDEKLVTKKIIVAR
jgi:hypothetical protein